MNNTEREKINYKRVIYWHCSRLAVDISSVFTEGLPSKLNSTGRAKLSQLELALVLEQD